MHNKGRFIFMVSFDSFAPRDGMPIYLQIIKHIKSGMVAGEIQSGDELPSRRMLSAMLGINPNTIQKAYRILEDEGLIESHAGAKSYMVFEDRSLADVRRELVADCIGDAVAGLRSLGIDKDTALQLVATAWDALPSKNAEGSASEQ